MSGAFRDGEIDPVGRPRYYPRFLECSCREVEKGECRCEDDGMVTHGGVVREGQEHGHYLDGRFVRCSLANARAEV